MSNEIVPTPLHSSLFHLKDGDFQFAAPAAAAGVTTGAAIPPMRYFSFGNYGGFACNWVKNAPIVKSTGLHTGVKWHYDDPWEEKFWRCLLTANGYDLKGPFDPAWVAHNEESVDAIIGADLYLDVCGSDMFFDDGSIPHYPKRGTHFLRHNNIGFNFADVPNLSNDYDWFRQKQTFLIFQNHQAPSTYTTNAMGDFYHRSWTAIGDAIKKALKNHPAYKKPVKVRFFNEQRGEVSATGGHVYSTKAHGEVNEIEHWIEWILSKCGLRKNIEFVFCSDWYAWDETGGPHAPAWKNMMNANGYITNTEKWIHEVHGLDDPSMIQPFEAHGFDAKATHWSTDAKNEHDPNYFKGNHAFYTAWKNGAIDKFDDKFYVPVGWHPAQSQKNFDDYYQRHCDATRTGAWK